MSEKYNTLAKKLYRFAGQEMNLPGFKFVEIEFIFDREKEFGGCCECYNQEKYLLTFNLAYCFSLEVFSRCFFHELVHVEQYHAKKLTVSLESRTEYWNGKRCDMYKNELLAPWEIEATLKSKQLFEKFMKK